MPDAAGPSIRSHQPNWTTGRCRTCTRLWPCLVARVLLEAFFRDAPLTLRAFLEGHLAEAVKVHPDRRVELHQQVLGWLD